MKTKIPSQRIASKAGLFFLLACVVGLGVLLALLCLLAAILCRVDLPLSSVSPLCIFCTCAAALCAGTLFSTLHGMHGIWWGGALGTFFFVLQCGMALVAGRSVGLSTVALKGLPLIFAGMLGGYLGLMLREHRRRLH